MDNKTDFIVKIHEKYSECLNDQSNNNCQCLKKRKKPDGFVEIFEIENGGKKQLLGKHNLVLYQGREWITSRAFGTQNLHITPTQNEFISWFGAGIGGCPIGDPLNPTSPTNIDIELANPVMLNATDITFGDYRTIPETGYYKMLFDSIEFEQDPDNYNAWLIVKIAATLSISEANGKNLNEAGLYTAESNNESYNGPFHLYARITFPTIVKTSERQLIFVWYIYF